MDRLTLERRLAWAERHVEKGERYLAEQRELVAELQRGGHSTTQATAVLHKLEQALVLHLGSRNRLRKQLGLDDFPPS